MITAYIGTQSIDGVRTLSVIHSAISMLLLILSFLPSCLATSCGPLRPEIVSGNDVNGKGYYWQAENEKTSGQGFVMKLGSCKQTIEGIQIQNTKPKHPNAPIMGTKRFRISGSLSAQGPWGDTLLEEELEDGRRLSGNSPPILTFYFRLPVTLQFLRFELVDFYGIGGGLQYFLPVGKEESVYTIKKSSLILAESSLVYRLPGEHRLEQNILLTTLPTLDKQWRLTFDQTWKKLKN